MNTRTAAIVGAAWNAGNCCLIGHAVKPDALLINTPNVVGYTLPTAPGGLILPPAANANLPRQKPRPVA